ncbi:MAG: DUF1598 domain-containing protein [Pirellulales bacterium]
MFAFGVAVATLLTFPPGVVPHEVFTTGNARAEDTTPTEDAALTDSTGDKSANAQVGRLLERGDYPAALTAIASVDPSSQRDALLQQVVKTWVARHGGALGGGVRADFDTLINLIESTIEPESWNVVGGDGSIMPFPGGVYVDAAGALTRNLQTDRHGELERLVRAAFHGGSFAAVRTTSPLRKVSLPRLERHVRRLLDTQQPLPEDVRFLAGLQRIEYVFVDDERGELVIAGPAGDWTRDDEGRVVATQTGRPVLWLDDLVMMLRLAWRSPPAPVGCSINPRPEGLAGAQAFLDRWAGKSVDSRRRTEWLEQIRSEVGTQTIEYFGGIEPGTRVARVMIEADYRMKLVGMGLEAGVPTVPCYLDLVARQKSAPALDVLRWWFAVDYDAITASPDRRGYALNGQGVCVLSENELLTRTGQQVHTGESNPLNRQFAAAFTDHFSELADVYPIYADLQNVFDLAVVTTLLRAEQLPRRAGWAMQLFGPAGDYEVPLGHTPQTVETVLAHRVVDRRRIIAGVSGGVMLDVGKLVDRAALETSDNIEATLTPPENTEQWWWD